MRERRVKSPRQSVAGSLLLAHPSLHEETFRHTVILMSAHDPEGALGVVFNRPLGKRLGDLNGEFALGPLAPVPVYMGGPVQPQQLILAAWETKADGFRLHFGIEPLRAIECLAEGMQVRAFMGYSGWSAGQLDNELKHNTWVISAIPEELIKLDPDEELWRRLLGAMGEEWRLLADEPDDPARN